MTEDKNCDHFNNKVLSQKGIIGKIIDEMCLFDDDLMCRVFDNNMKATELLLRIILEREIHVVRVRSQVKMSNPSFEGRSIILDIIAIDEKGDQMNIEVQGDPKGAHVRRARFHSSSIDVRMLESNDSFGQLKDSYVIFFYKHDKFRKGLPIYHIRRMVKETGEEFNDGSNIIYVNGMYKGNDAIGHLIKDFHCVKPEDIHYRELADRVKYYKEDKEGRRTMCEAVIKYGDEREAMGKAIGEAHGKAHGRLLAAAESVMKLMENLNCSMENALDLLGISGEFRMLVTEEIRKSL